MAGFDVAGARKAGYSDDEIAAHLASDTNSKFDVAGALKAGYSAKEVLSHITGDDKDRSIMSAPAAGVAGFIGGVGETANQLGATGVGSKLKSVAERIAPANYESPRFMGEGSDAGDEGNLHKAGRVIAEQSGPMVAGLTAMRMTPGPWWAKLGAGAGVGIASTLGTRMKEQAQDGQDPTLTDKLKGAGISAAENVVGAAPGLRLVGGAPARSVTQAVGRAATTLGAEGAAGAGREAVVELGRGKKLSDLSLDDLGNAAISQAVASTPFTGARAAKDVGGANRYKDFEGANREASERVANKINNEVGDINPGVVNAKTNKGFEGVRAADDLTQAELGRAVDAFKNNGGQFTPAAEAVVKRAREGKVLSERDHEVLDRSLQGNSAGTALAESVRDAGVVAMLKKQGNYNEAKGTFTGGLSGAIGKQANVGNFVKAGAASLFAPGLIAMSPQLATAVAGTYALGRMGGKFTGNINPANRFVERFKTGNAQSTPLPQQPQQPPSSGRVPNVPLPPQPWGPTPPQMTPAPQRPAVPTVPSLVAQLNQQGGPGFGLSQPPAVYGQNVMAQVRALNKITKRDGKMVEQQARNDRADAERTNNEIDQTMPLVRALAAMQREKASHQQVIPVDKPYTPGNFPPDVINAGAPQPQRMLPPPDANRAIPMPAPEPQKLLPPPQSQVAARSLASNPAFAEFLAKMKQQPETQGPAQPDTPDALAALLSGARAQARMPQPAPVAAPEPAPQPAPQQGPPPVVPPVTPSAAPAAAPARSPELMTLLNASLAKEKAAKLASPPAGDIDLTIPDFLKRVKGETPVAAPAKPAEGLFATAEGAERAQAFTSKKQKEAKSWAENVKPALKVEEPKAPKPALAQTPAEEGPARSPIYAREGAKATIQASIDTWMADKGHKLTPERQETGIKTIKRVLNEKYATAKKIAKEAGLDTEATHDFTSRFVHTRSDVEGAALRDWAKQQHPEKPEVFDRLLSDETFSSIYYKRGGKTGSDKARKKLNAEATKR